MKEYIYINWEQYKKVTKWCPEWLHGCPWKKIDIYDYQWWAININNQKCLWDSVEPDKNWQKWWMLSCPCKKCTTTFLN